ncbi:MAG: response regulator [Pseudomonadota bacterium]
MKSTKLRTKLIMGVVGIISLLILPAIFIVQYTFGKAFMEEYHKKAAFLAHHVNTQIMNPLLAGNEAETKLTLSKIKEVEKSIEYVFIIDSEGRVPFSTFAKDLPAGLLNANQVDHDLPYKLQHLETEKGTILDIAIPISEGSLGSARIGITEDPLRQNIVRITVFITSIALGVLAIGVVLALVFARITTRPVYDLIGVADAITKGDLEKTAKIDTQDEIGHLASSFNKMTGSLKGTLSELKQIFDGSLSAMRLVDRNFTVINQNKAMHELTGIAVEQARGGKCYELFKGTCCHTDACPLREIVRGKQRLDMEDERETIDGATIPCRVMVTPFKDSQGNIIGVIEVFTDISESKRLISELRKQTKNLEESNHIQEAYNAVVTTLNSGFEMKPLLKEVVGRIIEYMDAQVGVIYLYSEEERLLKPVAAYALDIDAIKEGFKFGHGLPGQAAMDKKMVLVSDVPEDYFRISSGGGQRIPKNVVCLPIIFHNKLLGVLELCSVHEFEEKNLRFLKVVADQIGTGVNNVISYLKAEELAGDLREKNEILASQNEELQSQSEELIAQSEELQSQTEELEAQKRMLEEKTHQAQEADRLKSEFLSNMSHELRTPLNAALGMTRLMADGSAGPPTEKQKKYLEIIERNGENLLLLINDILDLSRIESGKIEITVGVVHFRKLVSGIAASLKPLIDEKGLSLNIDIDDHIVLQSDADKLRQILVNLLGNAVKFTDKGTISVVARDEKDDDQKDVVKISVMDTGIGIKEEHLEHIFGAFRQVDGSVTRRYGGTGLGLNICWKLAQLLGGKIEVASEFGKGSAFTVTLPKELTAPKGQIEGDWKEKVKEALLDEVKAPPKEIYEGAIVSKELLITDDDPIVVRELRTILKDENYWLRFAFNGSESLRHIEERVPDLILLDLQMPEMDGFQVLEKLEANENYRNIPIIILTALDVTKEEKARFGANVKGVIVKGGIDKASLIDQIRGILYGRKPLPEKTERAKPVHRKRKKASPPFKILIVEDNQDNMILIRETLRPSGYVICTAEDGEKGVEIAQKELPDLILMDIQMPGMSGLEAGKKIREIESLKDVPVIALTARAMTGEREAILEAGLDDYLAKPVSPKDLIGKVREWLSG